VRSLRRAEEWKQRQELHALQMRHGETVKEAHIMDVIAGKERDRRIIALQRKLKEEEKLETAARLDRQRQLRLEKLRERVDASLARVGAIQAQKADIWRYRQDLLAQLQKEKDRMNTMLMELVLNNQTDRRGMQRLAETYGLDFDAIQRKADAMGGGRLLRRSKSESNLPAAQKRTLRGSARSESARARNTQS
jgi:hypothetical protein